MPSSEHSGRDLSAATLHSYLKDPTFVEYFNSFLLLPAFSSRVFYNADTNFFEQVHDEGLLGWMEGGVVSSSSQASLYLADEVVGQSLDQQQSWLWVVQHRLPLFLRSDLFSEYKLCKLLTTTLPELRVQTFQFSKHSTTKTSTPSPAKQPRTHAPQQPEGTSSLQEELDTITLPSLPVSPPSHGQRIPRRSSLTVLPQGSSTQVHAHHHRLAGGWQNPSSSTLIAASKSDIELGSAAKTVPPSGHRFCHKRSSSVELPSMAVTYLEAPLHADDKGLPSHLVPEFLGTKSGMGAFWRFLRGTAGERNWLFWLDAERMKYYHKPIDQQRFLRELREHYLHAGAPLELPAESRSRLHVSKSSCLTLQQIGELQQALVEGLREYWCPRFILHHCHSPASRIFHPHSSTAPAFFRSFSAAPATPHTFTHSHPPRSHTDDTLPSNYTHLPPSLTPTQTPTIRRLASSRPRSKSSPTSYKKIQEASPSLSSGKQLNYHSSRPESYTNLGLPDFAMPLQSEDKGGMCSMSHRPHTVDTASLHPPVRGQSRKVWDKRTERSSPQKEGRSQSSMAHFNQLAKYTHHHLPDVNSRCASVLDSKDGPVCNSRCQILSVSGTPLHTLPSTPTPAPQGDVYTPLLYCLTTEQRKAGGYFQQYLEQLEDKAYLHCLLFWRDVQEYKSLFTAASFSPCEVERKAKALHSRYITEIGDEGIRCPLHVVGGITSHLWPAYEDLFDEAEEHALRMLLEKWVELCNNEDFIFQKLDVVSRNPSPRSSRRGLTSDIIGLEDLDEEELYQYEEGTTADILGSTFTPRSSSPTKYPFRSPSRMNALHPLSGTPHTLTRSPSPLSGSMSQVHVQSRAVGLNDIMDNPTELEHFKIFLNEHYAAQDLMCWMEIEAFRGIPVSDKHVRDLKARQLRNKYFNKKYLFGPNSPASKDAQRQVVAAGGGGYGGRLPARPRTAVFREAQKHVRAKLEKRWLAEFISTPEFIDRNGGSTVSGGNREASKSAKSSKPFAYEKSFANSHEAILFRRALQEEETREPFQRYLCIKASPGTYPRENIQFWLEVQKYKEMYHAHTTEELLQQKVSAIVNCYLQSSVPPWLQLDIPQAIADQAVKKQQGPYIFREAQAAVFKNLYYNWQDYKNFISSCKEDEIDSAISNFESQIRHLQTTSKERKSQSKPEEDTRSLFMPRFETAAEREERLRREKELAEFGKVAVAFRLSSPDPNNYTYYTELPAKFYTEEELLELRKQRNKDGGFKNDSGVGMPLSVDFQSDKCSDSTETETTPQKQHSHFHSSKPVCSSIVPSTSSKHRNDHIPRGKKPKKQPLVSSSRFLPQTAIRTQGSYGTGLRT